MHLLHPMHGVIRGNGVHFLSATCWWKAAVLRLSLTIPARRRNLESWKWCRPFEASRSYPAFAQQVENLPLWWLSPMQPKSQQLLHPWQQSPLRIDWSHSTSGNLHEDTEVYKVAMTFCTLELRTMVILKAKSLHLDSSLSEWLQMSKVLELLLISIVLFQDFSPVCIKSPKACHEKGNWQVYDATAKSLWNSLKCSLSSAIHANNCCFCLLPPVPMLSDVWTSHAYVTPDGVCQSRFTADWNCAVLNPKGSKKMDCKTDSADSTTTSLRNR